jgi:hypothetical protein
VGSSTGNAMTSSTPVSSACHGASTEWIPAKLQPVWGRSIATEIRYNEISLVLSHFNGHELIAEIASSECPFCAGFFSS